MGGEGSLKEPWHATNRCAMSHVVTSVYVQILTFFKNLDGHFTISLHREFPGCLSPAKIQKHTEAEMCVQRQREKSFSYA